MIEMERLGAPVGKQDPYIAAFGGLTCFRFLPGGAVEAWPLALAPDTLANLEENLLLFYTGITRPAARVLAEQDRRGRAGDAALLDNLHAVKALGAQSRAALEAGDLAGFAALMNTHWEIKKARASGTSSPQIDAWYALARANGALGGKLIGAGGGGFLMFYAEDKVRLRAALRAAGLAEVRFRFDFEGTRVVAQS